MIYFYIVLFCALILIGYGIYNTYTFTKKYIQNGTKRFKLVYIKEILYSSVAMQIALIALVILCNFYYKYHMSAIDLILSIVGFSIFSFALNYLYFISGLTLYRKDLLNKVRCNYTLYIILVILTVILSLLLALESIAAYIKYPLPNGIMFSKTDLLSLHRFNTITNNPTLPFYGMTMVGGAIISLLVSDYHFYKKFGKHGMLDNLFLVAFPAGLVGGRLWYCLVLESEYYLQNPSKILHIWEGGMGIMGGATLGIIAGVLFMLIFKKEVSIFFAIDAIVPTILIAQAIGRWGNFFNHEVFGKLVDYETLNFLPTFIQNHMAFNFNDFSQGVYVPLFLIECITNLLGYYFITRFVPKVFKKIYSEGDLAGWYLIWYGLTRTILEPLRFGEFRYDKSFNTSFILMGCGLAVILFCHIHHYLKDKKQLNKN